jgi:glutathionyl-hydroquinone reductase
VRPRYRVQVRFVSHTRAMSTTRDVSHLSDITKIPTESDGSFKRAPAVFRDHIEKGGRFQAEVGRYRLYVSYACRAYLGDAAFRTQLELIVPFLKRGLRGL